MAILSRAQAKQAYWRSLGVGRAGRKATALTLARKIELLRVIETLRERHGIARALDEAATVTGVSSSMLKRLYYANRGVLRRWDDNGAIWRKAHDQLRAFVEAFPIVQEDQHAFTPEQVTRWAADFDTRPFSAEPAIRAAIAAHLRERGALPKD